MTKIEYFKCTLKKKRRVTDLFSCVDRNVSKKKFFLSESPHEQYSKIHARSSSSSHSSTYPSSQANTSQRFVSSNNLKIKIPYYFFTWTRNLLFWFSLIKDNRGKLLWLVGVMSIRELLTLLQSLLWKLCLISHKRPSFTRNTKRNEFFVRFVFYLFRDVICRMFFVHEMQELQLNPILLSWLFYQHFALSSSTLKYDFLFWYNDLLNNVHDRSLE
jgi:hypothetical protein